MKKRILSLFLALGLLLSLLPTAALAVGSGTDSVPVSSDAVAAPVEAESTGAVKGGGGGGLVWHSAFEGENSLLGWQIIDANADGHTFARVQDGALCPDSAVRISIALDDGSLYRFDATGYDARPLEVTWAVDEETARAALPEGLKVKDSRAVILQSPGGLAVPCYAFTCRDADGRTVEICVHAETGKQYRITVAQGR